MQPDTTQPQDTRHTVFYACKYAPVELLAGFGADVRLATAEPGSFEVAETLAHGNLCGYGKGLLDAVVRGEVRELVLTSCCDVMRRVMDVLAAEKRLDFVWMLDLPHRVDEPSIALYKSELKRFAEAYTAYSGARFDVGRALAALADPATPQPYATSLLGAHAPVSLLGALGDLLPQGIENLTCTGSRVLGEPPRALARPAAKGCGACDADSAAELDRFFGWYAMALLTQGPCMRMTETGGRTGLFNASNGIVYHTMKFCDYYGFEYADLVATDLQTPVLKVETDGTPTSSGQLRTRIEAFAETLDHQTPTPAPAAAPAPTATESPLEETVTSDATLPTAPFVLGVDSGSTSTDAVVVNAAGKMIGHAIVATGAKATAAAGRAIEAALAQAGIAEKDLALRVATGYGRDAIPGMDKTVTEITCHARGAHALLPEVRTIVDIGGQDSKVIHLSGAGAVDNFVMNDKCAAGTGRFLETMARTLEMELADFCEAGLTWKNDVTISSMCTVFAESEVVSLVANDTPAPDVIHGLNVSVAKKTSALARRVGAEPSYLMTGGVAKNGGVVAALEEALGAPVATHEDSQLCGALGAALIGLKSL